MKNKKIFYRQVFTNSASELSTAEKRMLFQQILKSAKKRKVKKIIYSLSAACVLLIGSLFFFLHLNMPSRSISIVEISTKNKRILEGKNNPLVLTSDKNGLTLGVNSITSPSNTTNQVLHLDTSSVNDQVYTTIYIPYGQRKEIFLPDNSRVWLNAGSLFTFKNDMNGKDRETYLDGEGYFDIVNNSTKFIIHTKKSKINVLGTSFNLSSYDSDNFQSLDLLTGKVSLESNDNNFSSLTMTAGERMIYNFQNNHVVLEKNSKGDDILWTKKQLKLNKSTLPTLFKRLEKIYNVTIEYEEFLNTNEPYSGRLNLDVDIISLLNNIYELKDYKIELKERKVTIRR